MIRERLSKARPHPPFTVAARHAAAQRAVTCDDRNRERAWASDFLFCRLVLRLEAEDTVAASHGGLDVQALDLLPVLGQQRHEVVDGARDVVDDIRLRHLHVGNGHAHAQRLLALELELDGGLLVVDFVHDIVGTAQHRREFAGFVQTRAHDTRDLTDERRTPGTRRTDRPIS